MKMREEQANPRTMQSPVSFSDNHGASRLPVGVEIFLVSGRVIWISLWAFSISFLCTVGSERWPMVPESMIVASRDV